MVQRDFYGTFGFLFFNDSRYIRFGLVLFMWAFRSKMQKDVLLYNGLSAIVFLAYFLIE